MLSCLKKCSFNNNNQSPVTITSFCTVTNTLTEKHPQFPFTLRNARLQRKTNLWGYHVENDTAPFLPGHHHYLQPSVCIIRASTLDWGPRAQASHRKYSHSEKAGCCQEIVRTLCVPPRYKRRGSFLFWASTVLVAPALKDLVPSWWRCFGNL